MYLIELFFFFFTKTDRKYYYWKDCKRIASSLTDTIGGRLMRNGLGHALFGMPINQPGHEGRAFSRCVHSWQIFAFHRYSSQKNRSGVNSLGRNAPRATTLDPIAMMHSSFRSRLEISWTGKWSSGTRRRARVLNTSSSFFFLLLLLLLGSRKGVTDLN